MAKTTMKFKLAPFVMLVTFVCLLFASGCARYARNVNTLYEPSATVSGGSGEVYIIIPESQQTRSSDMKWVLGKVKDDNNNNIDEVFSPRSAAEIVQAAFGREFKKAGYTVKMGTKRTGGEQMVIDLTKTEIELEQISDLADIKAKCRVLARVDVYKNGQQITRFQYESTSSRTDFRDRDILARAVLDDTLQSLMRKAMQELHSLFKR